MARAKSSLLVLDKVERLFAPEVYHFDETAARESGATRVGWEARTLSVPLESRSYDPQVALEEKDGRASLKRVVLKDLDSDALVLKPDNFSVRHYKTGTYNKACDYLVLTEYNGSEYAIFIDLKTKLYEPQDANGGLFVCEKENDANIVWQMIGADSIFDTCVDVIGKKENGENKSTCVNKKRAAKSSLAKFKRRYIVLYSEIDITGEQCPRSTSYQSPNRYILEAPVHVMNVQNNDTISIGDFFSRGGLEL